MIKYNNCEEKYKHHVMIKKRLLKNILDKKKVLLLNVINVIIKIQNIRTKIKTVYTN